LAHKSKSKSALKEIRALISDKKMEQAKTALNETISTFQSAASKGVIPKKRAARKISRIARAVNRVVSQKTP
jgi:small subunit ribosomal protein S20